MSYSQDYIEQSYRMVDDQGRRFQTVDLSAAKPGGDTSYEWKGYRLRSGRYWAYSKANMEKFEKEDRLYYTKSGLPRLKYYLDEMPGVPVQDLWNEIKPIGSQASERLGYDTQKPEALLERIIKTSSNQGDVVLDSFVGSGTTAVVAEKLGRRWIACDLGRFAIHTTRKRLLGIEKVRPFAVQNLGKYERQAWQSAEFASPDDLREREARYRKFILDLYHATPISGYAWIHGMKNSRMVHVGAVDAPVTLSDVKAIAAEVWRAVGTGKGAPQSAGVDVLGWEFALELNELAKQVAAEARVDVAFKKIPRECWRRRRWSRGISNFLSWPRWQ